MNPLFLPDGFRPFFGQVAGHTFLENTDAIGLLQDAEDASCILKPLGKPACAERELSFYETLQRTKDPVLLELKPLVPCFYQQVQLHINQRDVAFLKLENLSYNMCKPCVMDIKVGRRTYDPEASPKKRAVEEKKYIKCKQALGLCIPGFQVYDHGSGLLIRHGKEFGKQIDVAGFKDALKLFLNLRDGLQKGSTLLNEVLRQLYKIRDWFNKQKLLHFYASSVLITYDYDGFLRLNNPHINGNIEHYDGHAPQWVKVRMIDFAHVYPAIDGTSDVNYIFGLKKLIEILEQFRT